MLQYMLEILGLASAVLSQTLTGNAAKGLNIGDALLSIVQKAVAAHEAHTGQPLDPTLIKAIDPIP